MRPTRSMLSFFSMPEIRVGGTIPAKTRAKLRKKKGRKLI
jgi:hypothetical protein